MLGSTLIVDGKTDGWTDGQTKNRTPISHLAKAGVTKKLKMYVQRKRVPPPGASSKMAS